MYKILMLLLLPVLAVFSVRAQETEDEGESGKVFPIVNYTYYADRDLTPSVDHTKFSELKVHFEDGHQVTAACLSCHTGRGHEILRTSHWQWQREEVIMDRGVIKLGKKNILNNFCIGVAGSEGTCTRCHIGYGWKDKSFDFSDQNNIDCLICHDRSGTYQKERGAAGYPKKSVNLSYVAQHIGIPGKDNCGVCHFWGGGGNNVKHGDLEKALLDCSREVDVHMTSEGENMTCSDCHVTQKHKMAGKLYALSSENVDRATCEYCHTEKPHTDNILNEHNIRVACQTCHIPIYAKVNGTKMIWDWSTAGRLDEGGRLIYEHDIHGNHNYLSIKGNFVYDNHVVPEYYWFNGIADHFLITDTIKQVPVQMNTLDGAYRDKGQYQRSKQPSKIWPVKVHRGKQIYDPVNKTLIQPKLWSPNKGEGAYWADFDWEIAAEKGMEYIELPFSGEIDFVETEMYWPLNHMVSPADQSLKCIDCHTREGGRLENLTDFYLPGRDFNPIIETAGVTMIIISLILVLMHGICRVAFRNSCYISNLTEGGSEE